MLGRRPTPRLSRRSQSARGELAQLESYLARNLFSWMRADYRTLVDYGGGDIRVSAFPDKVALESEGAVAPNARSVDPAHAFAQGTQARQIAAPAAAAALAGREAGAFVRATGNFYDSTIAAINWKFMHDGTGGEAWLTNVPTLDTGTQTFWGTRNTSGAGISVIRNISVAGSQTMYVLTAANGFVVQSTVTAGTPWPLNTACYVNQRFSSGTPNWAHQRNGSVLASGAQLISPDTGAASFGVRLGSDGGNPGDFLFADLMLASRVDVTLRAAVQRYNLLRYGIA